MKKNKGISIIIILIVFCVAFSCSKTKVEVVPNSIVGIWKLSGLTTVTDAKTLDANKDELNKVQSGFGDKITSLVFEFKDDGTCSIPNNNIPVKPDLGKYVISSDKKNIVVTYDEKGVDGKQFTDSFSIISINSDETRLGISTLSNKKADGSFDVSFSNIDFVSLILATYVFVARGLDAKIEIEKTKKLTSGYILKK